MTDENSHLTTGAAALLASESDERRNHRPVLSIRGRMDMNSIGQATATPGNTAIKVSYPCVESPKRCHSVLSARLGGQCNSIIYLVRNDEEDSFRVQQDSLGFLRQRGLMETSKIYAR
jgi:hypothetical protein